MHSNPKEEERDDLKFSFSNMTFGNETPIGVHAGFKAQYQASLLNLKELLQELEMDIPEIRELPVLTTGHSLGGGLAKICALDYACQEENAGREVICIPMASPSPFKEPDLFNRKLHDSTLCINNKRDRVLNAASFVYKPKSIGYDATILAGKILSDGHMEGPYTEIVDTLTDKNSPDLDKNSLIQDSVQPSRWARIRGAVFSGSPATSFNRKLTPQEQESMPSSHNSIQNDPSLTAALRYQTTAQLAARTTLSVDRKPPSDHLFNQVQSTTSEKFFEKLDETAKKRLEAFEKSDNRDENIFDDEDDKNKRQSL